MTGASDTMPATKPADLLEMVDEAGVIDTMFDALNLMAIGLQDRDNSDAVQRVVLITQERFRLLQASIERLHEMSAVRT